MVRLSSKKSLAWLTAALHERMYSDVLDEIQNYSLDKCLFGVSEACHIFLLSGLLVSVRDQSPESVKKCAHRFLIKIQSRSRSVGRILA